MEFLSATALELDPHHKILQMAGMQFSAGTLDNMEAWDRIDKVHIMKAGVIARTHGKMLWWAGMEK